MYKPKNNIKQKRRSIFIYAFSEKKEKFTYIPVQKRTLTEKGVSSILPRHIINLFMFIYRTFNVYT